MKRFLSMVLIAVFSFLNVAAFTGCREMGAEESEVRACWVASIGNLDFPSRMGLSASALKSEIDSIIENCSRYGLNTIFFQVRPNGDALYGSKIFPWSVYLSGTQGEAPSGNFDPLSYFVKKAHRAKIRLHAWINPYRVGSGDRVWENLSSDNPALLHPEYTITTPAGVYYDPGLPAVQNLIIDGVAELVENYEIDGIHFDDYFYPYDQEGFDDSKTYATYGKGLSIEDFRRKAVDQMVEGCYKKIKSIDSKVQFGISPFGIWANRWVDPTGSDTRGLSSYSDIFADSKKWVEEGWLDYICPQLYWTDQHPAAPYDVLVDWWDDLCVRNKMPLYVGLAFHYVGTDQPGFEDGVVMGEQLRYAASKRSYAGHCFFRYGVLSQNTKGALDSIMAYYDTGYNKKPVQAEYQELPLGEDLSISSPENGITVEKGTLSVSGVAPAGSPVSVNGTEALLSERGLYAAYISLKKGWNTVTVRSGEESRSIRVNYAPPQSVTEFKDPYPTGAVIRNSGEILTFTASAPVGASVLLTNGTVSVPLLPVKEGSSSYRGVWTVPAFPSADKLTLEGFHFEVTVNGKKTEISADLQLQLYSGGYREKWILQGDAYIFDESSGGSQMDHDPLRKGTRVCVVGKEGTRALLENGYWVEQELLGEDSPGPAEPSEYDYKIINISAKEVFGYSSSCDGETLEISLSAGRDAAFEIDTDQSEIRAELFRSAQSGEVLISSGLGRKIAGYEIIQQKSRITVYLRFHSGGLSGKRIVVDAGHGGFDNGTLGPGGASYPSESELNLLLADTLRQELENAGAEVIMIRTMDRTVTLQERVETARSYSPDLFISLHHNSASQTSDFTASTGGLMLYSSPLSKSLASVLSETLWNGVGEKAVRCKRQSLYVCRETRYPAVLVEAGYLCNPLEYEMLCRKDIAKKIAKNILKGLRNYYVTVCS